MKRRLAGASIESDDEEDNSMPDVHRISGKQRETEEGLMSKDDFQSVHD